MLPSSPVTLDRIAEHARQKENEQWPSLRIKKKLPSAASGLPSSQMDMDGSTRSRCFQGQPRTAGISTLNGSMRMGGSLPASAASLFKLEGATSSSTPDRKSTRLNSSHLGIS